jgi:hypothetical protein
MQSMVARAVGVEDESPMLLVGFGESEGYEGRDFVFQCDLRHNDYPAESNWPRGETYCVTDSDGRASFGGVLEAVFHGRSLRLVLDERTVSDLRLPDAEWEVFVDNDDVDLAEVSRQLRRILTCGRPEFRPRVLEA